MPEGWEQTVQSWAKLVSPVTSLCLLPSTYNAFLPVPVTDGLCTRAHSHCSCDNLSLHVGCAQPVSARPDGR